MKSLQMSEAQGALRRSMREQLAAVRATLDTATLGRYRFRIDAGVQAVLDDVLGPMAGKVLAFCWPIRNEYDARPLAKTWRERGALTALPVVAGKNQPLGFRVWTPGDPMRRGPLDIPTPASGRVVTPDVMLLPMLGWDARGYRLGYGGGFFDRTLAALAPRPIALGVTYECLRLDEFESMDWDQPMDWVVTESTVYRRAKDRLETWSR